MYHMSPRSREKYASLCDELKIVVDELLEHVDITLLDSYREEARQNMLYFSKQSKVKWPDSKHNVWPSDAIDLQPYPYPTDEKVLWATLGLIAGRAMEIAEKHGFKLRWGFDWDSDGDLTDQSFYDGFHLEVVR